MAKCMSRHFFFFFLLGFWGMGQTERAEAKRKMNSAENSAEQATTEEEADKIARVQPWDNLIVWAYTERTGKSEREGEIERESSVDRSSQMRNKQLKHILQRDTKKKTKTCPEKVSGNAMELERRWNDNETKDWQ